MKTAAVIICVTILVAVLMCLAIGYKLATFLAKPKRITLESARETEKSKGYWGDFDEYPIEEYKVRAGDGYELCTCFAPAKEESDRYVIITHGYTYNRYGSVKYLHLFRNMGFNCIIYDDRAHGLNAEAVCTMGLKESEDLLDLIEDTYARYGKNIRLGLHGESMGSALTTIALMQKPRVEFAVLDCGFSSLVDLVKEKLKGMFHCPTWFMYPSSLMCKLCYGYWLGEVEPVKALYENEIPICIMHGKADRLINYTHAQKLQKANRGYCELHLFEGADHAESLNSDEDRYIRTVKEFIECVEQEK